MKFLIALVVAGITWFVARLLLVSLDGLAGPAAAVAAVVAAMLVLALTLKPSRRAGANDGAGGALVGGALLAVGAAALAEADDSLVGGLADEVGGLAIDATTFAGSALADLFSDD